MERCDDLRLLATVLHAKNGAARQQAWPRFVERHQRTIAVCVRKALRRYGARLDDLDDLVADVWLQLLREDLRKLRQFDPTRGYRLSTFIGMVATNVTIDYLRGLRPATAPLEDADGAVAVEPADPVQAREQLTLLRAAIARLTAEERAFVSAVYEGDRTPEELARALGLTTATVYSRKHKIGRKLAKFVQERAAA